MKTATAKKSTTTASKTQSTTPKRPIKAKSSAAEELREFMVESLKDIYWAEKALTKALPKMAKNATTEKLIMSLNDHLEVTKQQVERVEKVFEILGEKATAKKCEAMEGLIKEGESIMEETQLGPVRDAGIIAACQKIEHYEIATYGTLVAYAETLGEEDAMELLAETLQEEKEADQILTDAAYNDINFEAAEAEGTETE